MRIHALILDAAIKVIERIAQHGAEIAYPTRGNYTASGGGGRTAGTPPWISGRGITGYTPVA